MDSCKIILQQIAFFVTSKFASIIVSLYLVLKFTGSALWLILAIDNSCCRAFHTQLQSSLISLENEENQVHVNLASCRFFNFIFKRRKKFVLHLLSFLKQCLMYENHYAGSIQERKCEESMSWDKFTKINLSEHNQVSWFLGLFIFHLMIFKKKKKKKDCVYVMIKCFIKLDELEVAL